MLKSDVTITGLDFNDAQGDKRLVNILQSMGGDVQVQDAGVHVRGGRALQGRTIDCNDIPDLVPTLAVLGTYAQGETHLINVPQARIKETDRLHSMSEGLQQLGADVTEHPAGLTVRTSTLQGANLHGYHDHRTVMALGLAGLMAQGRTIVDTAESIQKTFPTYATLMQSLGANIHTV